VSPPPDENASSSGRTDTRAPGTWKPPPRSAPADTGGRHHHQTVRPHHWPLPSDDRSPPDTPLELSLPCVPC
jgi:hypothetical protein